MAAARASAHMRVGRGHDDGNFIADKRTHLRQHLVSVRRGKINLRKRSEQHGQHLVYGGRCGESCGSIGSRLGMARLTSSRII